MTFKRAIQNIFLSLYVSLTNHLQQAITMIQVLSLLHHMVPKVQRQIFFSYFSQFLFDLLSDWLPKMKKSMTIALQKETMHYGSPIVRQGQPVENVFFILRYDF
jgi:hypothetical protein